MAKKTLLVQFEGKSFTRTTDRSYSHVVLFSQNPEKVLESRIAMIGEQMTDLYDYYRNGYKSGITRPMQVLCGNNDLQTVIEIRTAEIKERHQHNLVSGAFDMQAYAWSGRLDLAEKAARQCRKNYGETADRIVIVPVN